MDINTCRQELLGRGPAPEAEDWLIAQVCQKATYNPVRALCCNFLLDEFSRPFLEALSQHLYGEGYTEILGPYYEFISAEGGEERIPYYKVKSFKRKRDSKLRSYLSTITARYFTRLRSKELERERKNTSIDASDKVKSNIWECDLRENEWFGLLLSDDPAKEEMAEAENIKRRLRMALAQLPERERRVIELTVMDNASGLDAFEELASFLKSKKNQDEMTPKEKQQAIAVLKNKAIAHLTKLMKQ